MNPRLTAAIIAVVCALSLTGCVGPAKTTHTYESKAVRTANDSLSALQTALLSVHAAVRGRMMQTYLETVLSESEDAFSSIQSTFDSIQPPNTARADHLRDSLDKLLSDGSDGIAQLRILARRQDTKRLVEETHQLTATAASLDTFAKEHG